MPVLDTVFAPLFCCARTPSAGARTSKRAAIGRAQRLPGIMPSSSSCAAGRRAVRRSLSERAGGWTFIRIRCDTTGVKHLAPLLLATLAACWYRTPAQVQRDYAQTLLPAAAPEAK